MTSDTKNQLIERILKEDDLYKILSISRDADSDQVRRAYIQKSRVCHPDKFPGNVKATQAFQKLSSAYETLSKPDSKVAYDFGGERTQSFDSRSSFMNAFSQLYKEFIDGDLENILAMIDFVNRQNPEFTFDKINAKELLLEIRNILIVSGRYVDVAKDEVMRLYDIQTELGSLSYFNVLGRMKLTLKLSRVFLSIPIAMHTVVNEKQLISPNLAIALQQVTSFMEKAEVSLDVVKDWLLAGSQKSSTVPAF